MRFGGMICREWKNAEEWAQLAKEMGYTAVYFPVDYSADMNIIDSYINAAKDADLAIAEVGVWNNMLAGDEKERYAAIEKCVMQLELADYVGAGCCVNVSGSCGEQWDGPHADNLTEKTFERIVLTVQKIIDRVKPQKTFYTLEPMPWMYPDSADSYLDLIKSIDRKGFAVHFDPVNIIKSPQEFYRNTDIIREWFDKLGEYIKSCHAKDTRLGNKLTVHLDECRPGLGSLDYRTLLRCMSELEGDVPLMLEHMQLEEDYAEASKYVKKIARSIDISL